MPKRRAESREGMISLSLALPPELHRRLAHAAIDEQASMNELIRDAIATWLDARDRRQSRKGER